MPSQPAADAALESCVFPFEAFIKTTAGIDGDRRPAPDVCKFFLRGTCPRGTRCTLRHGRPGERRNIVVCKHWLRSLCKKGESCEFLHEMNASRMPTCWFFMKFGECVNGDECIYQHIDPERQRPECPWYNRGFCRAGPHCRFKHVRKAVCQLYLNGFCPAGLNCTNGHPRFEVPDLDKLVMAVMEDRSMGMSERQPGYGGMGMQRDMERSGSGGGGGGERAYRPLHEVVCYKCGQKGHYANRCTSSLQ